MTRHQLLAKLRDESWADAAEANETMKAASIELGVAWTEIDALASRLEREADRRRFYVALMFSLSQLLRLPPDRMALASSLGDAAGKFADDFMKGLNGDGNDAPPPDSPKVVLS